MIKQPASKLAGCSLEFFIKGDSHERKRNGRKA
jgi:hypothetical protein